MSRTVKRHPASPVFTSKVSMLPLSRALAAMLAFSGLASLPQAKENTPAPEHFDTTLHYALKVRNPTAVTLRQAEVTVFAPARETP